MKTNAVSSVFSVLQPVGGLQVSYAGQDLRSSRQALWVINATVTNNGSSGIKKADYDDAKPFSVDVLDGQIVEAPVISSENKYLEENLKANVTANRIVFSPVIFEPKDSYNLRILVLGPEGQVPSLKAEGKIAGVQQITYATPDSPNASTSVWKQITQADALWVHFARAIVYFFGSIFTVVLLALLVVAIMSPFQTFKAWRTKEQRTRRVKDYRQGENMGWEDRAISEIYIERGTPALVELKGLIEKSARRISMLNEVEPINKDGQFNDVIKRATPFYPSPLRDDLSARGLLSFDGVYPKWANGVDAALQNISEHLSIDLKELISKHPMKADLNYFDRTVFEAARAMGDSATKTQG